MYVLEVSSSIRSNSSYHVNSTKKKSFRIINFVLIVLIYVHISSKSSYPDSDSNY